VHIVVKVDAVTPDTVLHEVVHEVVHVVMPLARGGRCGLRSAANSDEQEPRLCVVCGAAEHLAEECPDADPIAVARTAQHTVHFHPATIFLDYHKPVTRRRRLNELPIDLHWQAACVLKST
jgi:hypothetical protein